MRTSPRLEQRREQHRRYKRDVQERGKPFHPYSMFHDTVMSLVVLVVIIVLSVIWKFTAGEEAGEEGAGWLGPLYAEKADPGTISFIPRPDWYFYFLFYLLRIFKWPDSVILGTVGIPTIILVLMLALPFVDVRRERRLSRRPVAVVITILTVISMGVLTYKGATAKETLASEVVREVDRWVERQGLPEEAVAGARLFAEAGCTNCHTYLGTGNAAGAPDLTEEGKKGKGLQFQIDHLRDPRSTTPGSTMPPFASLGDENLRKLAIFLEASKGEQ